MKIVPAESPDQIEDARQLFNEYAAWLEIDLCFQNFDAELTGLPGDYASPTGRLLLAVDGDQIAGCIALRKIDDGICEMKRMYVRPQFRGLGFGKLMAKHLEEYARAQNVPLLRLETGIYQREAIALYERLGFVRIAPFGMYKQDPLSRCYEKSLKQVSS